VVEFADIALHLPLEQVFTYSVPPALAARLAPGVRVRVPFQSRQVLGTCVAVHSRIPAFTTRPVERVVSERALFDASMLKLCGYIARRYGAGIGEVCDAALPAAVRSGRAQKTVRYVRLRLPESEVAAIVTALEPKQPKQARALRILADAKEPLDARRLASLAKVTSSPLETLAKNGYIEFFRVAPEPDELDVVVAREKDKALTAEQTVALEAITRAVDAQHYRGFLLFGVTGSGKTEVYLQALRRVVEAGRQGIVLVPEIALTPQTVARFKARFPNVAVLHSHLTDADRHREWRTIQSGEVDVVIGARSAIFAPLPRLGLIVVDEEHEGTFKQQNSPRYDAREVARARARFERAVLVLGSATPAVETWHRACSGRLELLRLPSRVGGGAFPESIVADLRRTMPLPGKPRIITDRLRAALIQVLARKEQSILFLNRRGYATAATCRACGTAMTCKNCDIVLVFHRRIGRVLCHYCGHEEPLPQRCGACEGTFRLSGFGTERIEEEVRQFLGDARIARMDSDTMRGRGAHDSVLSRFKAGELDVLIGTQMIAKGLDFPNVTLVGIVAADSTLHLPDYRASERTFSLVAQVSGRTGRGAKGGLVIVQTQCPDHFAIRLAIAHDYERFAAIELEARKRDGYPPYGSLARVVIQGPDLDDVIATVEALRAHLSAVATTPGLAILGPAPAPIELLNGQHRHHVVAKGETRGALREFVAAIKGAPRPKGSVRLLLDVDPQSML
jgi:primosomal protein N' (replication factor Y) (superfamily II helicase)